MRVSALIGLAILLPVLAGCGLSRDYWKSSLADQSDLDVCAASMDDRDGSLDAPWQARKKAALELVAEKKIKCDKQKAYLRMVTQKPNPVSTGVTNCFPDTYSTGMWICIPN